jgi:RNA polymerase sigma-70 factor (ECF subfamily)
MPPILAASPAPLCDALVTLAREPDQASWEAIARIVGADITVLARRITGSATLADDATQEALCRVRDEAAGFVPTRADDESGARSWILRVAATVALNVLRRQRRAQERDRRVPAAVADDTPDTGVEAAETSALLARAIAELPERYRVPLRLRYQQELGFERIAAELDLPLNTVRVRVHRALKLLRGRMARSGLSLGAALLADSLRQAAAAEATVASATASTHTLGGASVTKCSLVLASLLAVGAVPLVLSQETPPPTPASGVTAKLTIEPPTVGERKGSVVSNQDGKISIRFDDLGLMEFPVAAGEAELFASWRVGDRVRFTTDAQGKTNLLHEMGDAPTAEQLQKDGQIPPGPISPARWGVIESYQDGKARLRYDDGTTAELPLPDCDGPFKPKPGLRIQIRTIKQPDGSG